MDENKLPRPAMIALTVLRVVIGWHFLYEGVAKLTSTTWSAAGYMADRRAQPCVSVAVERRNAPAREQAGRLAEGFQGQHADVICALTRERKEGVPIAERIERLAHDEHRLLLYVDDAAIG